MVLTRVLKSTSISVSSKSEPLPRFVEKPEALNLAHDDTLKAVSVEQVVHKFIKMATAQVLGLNLEDIPHAMPTLEPHGIKREAWELQPLDLFQTPN
jgi:hypothetical protein